jgi:peptidoglycan hydrolase FlgJ
MPDLTLPPVMPLMSNPAATPLAGSEGAKARDAAQQFEALLLAQILRSVRESGRGFGKTDESGDCATDFAEQQFARVLAQQGGLGLARLIAAGLEHKPGESAPPAGLSR